MYAWITGERTNIGDSLLRRPYVAAIRQIGALDLWINRSTPDFLSGLGVEPSDRLTPGFARWYGGVIRSALRRKTFLVLNAGEFRAHPARVGLLCALLALSLMVRIRGGATVWVGVSVPPSGNRLLRIPVRWAGQHLEYVRWRDVESPRWIVDRPVAPDWAFAEGSPIQLWPSGGRELCAFVLRGDRDLPSAEWIEWARTLSADHGLRPVVVVQVRQDADRAARLAAALGGEVIDWREDSSHAEHESRIREIYRRSLLVVGDRLHGLIIGATEGSVPLGWVESSGGKIRRHFDAVGLDFAGVFEGADATDLPRLEPERTTAFSREVRDAVARARAELAVVRAELAQLRGEPRAVAAVSEDSISPLSGPAPV
ncbi:hypothetical protein ACI3KY_02460 [Microbacterium sp. ZW T2_14]|uniref:hypothetical protein n=1 Tax=Microbacterium sp. ZW T2_14 TaxID=3378079 RepID=UPI0038535CD9